MRTRSFEWHDAAAVAGAAAGRTGLDYLRAMIAGEIPPAPICGALGFALDAADPGFARFRGEAAEFHCNPMATVHGGYLATLLDSAMGSAVMTTLDAASAYTTLQLDVHLVRAAVPGAGPLVAEGRVVHRGGRVATAEGRVVDGAGKLLAHATTTCMILPRP